MPIFQDIIYNRLDPVGNRMFQYADQATVVAERVAQQRGVPVYYNNGFLSAGAGQGSTGFGGLLSSITSGLTTVLPAIFGQVGGPKSGVPALPVEVKTPPMFPGGQAGGPLVRAVGGAIIRNAAKHPVITAAAGAAATAGGAILARRGHHVQLPDGSVVSMRRHRRMNPCNIHALRRGLRRASAFERIARRVLHITSPRKHVSGFKLPHRRKK